MIDRVQLIQGNGDVVAALEEALAQARKGTIVAVSICGVTDAGFIGWHHAWKDDIERPWASILSAVSSSQHDLLTNGLPDD